MPLNLRGCVLNASLSQGATHFVLLSKQSTYANGTSSEQVNGSVTAITLLGVPSAISGPYDVKGDFSFENATVQVEGPEFNPPASNTYPFLPGEWCITLRPSDGSMIKLRLSRWGKVDGEVLNHFEVAWIKLRDHLRENTKAVEEMLDEIQAAKAQQGLLPNNGREAGDSDADNHDRDFDSDSD